MSDICKCGHHKRVHVGYGSALGTSCLSTLTRQGKEQEYCKCKEFEQ